MKNKKGFSLSELMIAIVISVILAVIVGTTYNAHIRNAKAIEGELMLRDLYTAQEIYFIKNKKYYDKKGVNFTACPELGVDFSRNKYFTSFLIGNDGLSGGNFIRMETNNAQFGHTKIGGKGKTIKLVYKVEITDSKPTFYKQEIVGGKADPKKWVEIE